MIACDGFDAWYGDRKCLFFWVLGLSFADRVCRCCVAGDDDKGASVVKKSIECLESVCLDLFGGFVTVGNVGVVGEEDVVVVGQLFLDIVQGLDASKSAIKNTYHTLYCVI